MLRRRPVAIAALIAAAAFLRAYGLGRYFDDWSLAWVTQDALDRGAVDTLIAIPFDQHWSPIWMAFEAVNISLAGPYSDVLIRSVVLAMTILSLITLSWLLRRLGLGAAAITAGMLVLGWHHLNAVAYYSFDCYSQIAVDLLSWTIGSLAVVAAIDDDDGRGRRRLRHAAALFLPAPFIKEQALSAIAALVVVSIWASRRGSRRAWDIRAIAVICAVWAFMFATLRSIVGREMDAAGPYAICLSCVPGNIGLLFGGVVLPWRTPDVYLALRDGQATATLLMPAIGAALVVALVVLGVRAWAADRGGARVPVLLAALMGSAAFPAALLAHVGELHAHGLLYWFAALVALSVDGWRARLRDRWRTRVLVPWAVGAYAVVLLIALQSNLGEMRENGERAGRWIARFNRAVEGVAAGSLIVVRGLDDRKGPADYSLLRLTTPGMLLGGSTALSVAGRRDLEVVQVVDEGVAATVAEANWDPARVTVVEVWEEGFVRR